MSMLGIIRFINFVSIWCLCFHKFVGIIWCSCTVVIYWRKVFKCKITIIICSFSCNCCTAILGKRAISFNFQSIQLKFCTIQ